MIHVNDKWQIPWRENMSVDDVLKACQFTHRHIVVSINNNLIPPGEYGTRLVSEDDQVKVVHVIGGG